MGLGTEGTLRDDIDSHKSYDIGGYTGVIGVILGLYWGYLGVISGLYRGYNRAVYYGHIGKIF